MGQNIRAGFTATGLIPLDRQQILKRIPRKNYSNPEDWTNTFNDFFEDVRNSKKPSMKKRKKVDVLPGKSVSLDDFENTHTEQDKARDEINSSASSSSGENEILESESEVSDSAHVNVIKSVVNIDDLKTDDFIEVSFRTEKQEKFFVGKVLNISVLKKLEVQFLRPNSKLKNSYIFPIVDDVCDISISQVHGKLPEPTKLRRGGYFFDKELALKSYTFNFSAVE